MKKLFALFSPFILLGCNGDKVRDNSIEETMVRESICVAASERFFLYKEAAIHFDHGTEAGRIRFEATGKINDFAKKVHIAREIGIGFSDQLHAGNLEKNCNRRLTNAEYSLGKK